MSCQFFQNVLLIAKFSRKTRNILHSDWDFVTRALNVLKAVTHGNALKSTVPGQNFPPYSTKILITFLLKMQIYQGKNHFVPQEAGFYEIFNSSSESLQLMILAPSKFCRCSLTNVPFRFLLKN